MVKLLRVTITVVLFTFVLFPIFLHNSAEASGYGDYIKVGLKYGSNSVASCTIRSENGFLLGTAEDREFEEGMPLPAYHELTVTYEKGNVVLTDEEGTLLSADLGSSGCIMPADYEDGGIIYLNDTPYRGGIMLLAKSDGTLTVINYISLEHYIYGVLNSEMGYTNPKEALKAQAVAARSFGELNIGTHSVEGFDVCTTTHCQVYKGYQDEHESTNDAVDETEGEMILYDGEPVTAFYFKNSGGYTQNVGDVWSYDLPYLKSVQDEYSPSYPWRTSLSFDAIQNKLEAAGYQPGDIESVSINDRNSNGAVSELKVVGNNATVYIKKEKIRNVLGATLVKSNRFSLESSDINTTNDSISWNVSNGFSIVTPDPRFYLIGGDGTVVKHDEDDPVYGFNGFSSVPLGNSVSETETVTSGIVYFSGYGYGHGVGMPQDSAIEMAKQGFDYDEILKYFYTDIEIE